MPITLHTGVASLEAGDRPQPEWFEVDAATAAVVPPPGRVGSGDRGGDDGGAGARIGERRGRRREAGVRSHRAHRHPATGVSVVDGLITGWHEPRASHLDLVEAIAGPELTASMYAARRRRGISLARVRGQLPHPALTEPARSPAASTGNAHSPDRRRLPPLAIAAWGGCSATAVEHRRPPPRPRHPAAVPAPRWCSPRAGGAATPSSGRPTKPPPWPSPSRWTPRAVCHGANGDRLHPARPGSHRRGPARRRPHRGLLQRRAAEPPTRRDRPGRRRRGQHLAGAGRRGLRRLRPAGPAPAARCRHRGRRSSRRSTSAQTTSAVTPAEPRYPTSCDSVAGCTPSLFIPAVVALWRWRRPPVCPPRRRRRGPPWRIDRDRTDHVPPSRPSPATARHRRPSGLPGTIVAGDGPCELALAGGRVWVSLLGDEAVAPIDPASGVVGDPVAVPGSPCWMAGDGDSLWVAPSAAGYIEHLDAATGRRIGRIELADGAVDAQLAFAFGDLWATVPPTDEVVRIDARPARSSPGSPWSTTRVARSRGRAALGGERASGNGGRHRSLHRRGGAHLRGARGRPRDRPCRRGVVGGQRRRPHGHRGRPRDRRRRRRVPGRWQSAARGGGGRSYLGAQPRGRHPVGRRARRRGRRDGRGGCPPVGGAAGGGRPVVGRLRRRDGDRRSRRHRARAATAGDGAARLAGDPGAPRDRDRVRRGPADPDGAGRPPLHQPGPLAPPARAGSRRPWCRCRTTWRPAPPGTTGAR